MTDSRQLEFERLFRSEYQGLCYYAYKYVKDFEPAREIVQEAFTTLWEKGSEIDYARNVKSYLTTSIHNRCLNYLRDNRKFNGNILEIENLLDSSLNNDLEDLNPMGEAELRNSIKAAIDELPEKCRQVFVLNRYEDLKYREIADKLGISIKTVEAQMSKALQHLRSRLAIYIKTLILILLWLNR